MYDNLNSFRAELNDCEVTTEDIEGLGLVTGITKNGSEPIISIYPYDTQASLENFFGGDGDYFMISYLGKMPRMSYDYHIDGMTEGKIFELDPTGDLFAKLMFNPSDDLVTGTISGTIPISLVTGEGLTRSLEGTTISKVRTLMIQTAIGEEETGVSVIDIMAFVEGMRGHLGKSYVGQVTYGTLQKKFSIEPRDDTRILSFSFGNAPLDNGTPDETDSRGELAPIINIAKEEYKEQAKAIIKMLDTPNKIYNTEVII